MSYIEMASPSKKVVAPPAHPKVSVMVDTAIKTLAEPKGSSLHAINKYIKENYTVDIEKLSHFVKKYLKSAVARGDLVQPKGKGAAGSFKINKQKPEANPKTTQVKSVKLLKMQTSTPRKTLKPKKALAKSPNKSPVKKLKPEKEQKVPADATFLKPKAKKTNKPKVSLPTKPRKSASLPAKIKKPKKLMSKKVPVSPNPKLNTTKSPKPVKVKGGARVPKTKKSPKPGKPAASVPSKKTTKVRQK